jgi:hypothetical protein
MLIVPIEQKSIYTHGIQSYFLKSFQKLQFESNNMIYEIVNDKIYKMKPYETVKEYELDDTSFRLNLQNENNEKKESYYIPINLQYNKLNVDKYKLKHNSLLTLYIENNKSIYFQTDENDITHSVKEDLITFLSLLKLYN